MRRALWLGCLVLLVRVGTAQEPDREKLLNQQPVTVGEIAINPEKYAHTILSIRGCFQMGFERVSLQPCAEEKIQTREEFEAFMNRTAWVEDAEYSEAKRKMGSREPERLFEYDSKRNEKAWEVIRRARSKANGELRAEVVFTGQFETVGMVGFNGTSGFGHLGAYRHELILLDVVDFKPAKSHKGH